MATQKKLQCDCVTLFVALFLCREADVWLMPLAALFRRVKIIGPVLSQAHNKKNNPNGYLERAQNLQLEWNMALGLVTVLHRIGNQRATRDRAEER